MNFEDKIFENRRFLFQNIVNFFPDNPWVIKATEKMKTSSKEEYKKMLKQGYELQNKFDEAVLSKLDIHSNEARLLFFDFIKHIEWFFKIDASSYNELIQLCQPHRDQFLIVNKEYSEFLLNLLLNYKKEVVD